MCEGDIIEYSLSPYLSNFDYDWTFSNNGNYVWQDAQDASIAVQWVTDGNASISIIQYCLDGSTQLYTLPISVLPNSGDCNTELTEDNLKPKILVKMTDILGRSISVDAKQSAIYIYDDGSVEKKYLIK